jgi:L-alanine-DL-glutamate epimerase-like enolase superfamily enzyme
MHLLIPAQLFRGHWSFMERIEVLAVDVIRPDPGDVGGIASRA